MGSLIIAVPSRSVMVFPRNRGPHLQGRSLLMAHTCAQPCEMTHRVGTSRDGACIVTRTSRTWPQMPNTLSSQRTTTTITTILRTFLIFPSMGM